jgi:hypothetical protein
MTQVKTAASKFNIDDEQKQFIIGNHGSEKINNE